MLRWLPGLLLWAVAGLFAMPAAAEPWRMAETEHFRVFGQRSETKLSARAVLLEDFRGLLLTMTDGSDAAAAAPKLDIYLLDTIAQSVPFGKISPNIAGYYSASAGGIVAFAEETVLGEATLLHEYAHHFMLGGSRAAYPAWYVEGFAEYFMTSRFAPAHIDFGDASKNRVEWLVHGRWHPIDRMLARNFRARSSDETAMFYAQSWLLTHYLYRAPEMKGRLVLYLKAVAAGADPVAAFRQHIDPNPRGFNGRLRGYLKSTKLTYSRYTRTAGAAAAVKMTTLTPAAEQILLLGVMLERGLGSRDEDEDEEEAESNASKADTARKARILAAAKAAAGRWPDDPLARRTLILAEMQIGDAAAAQARLDGLLAASPNDSDLLRWRALLELRGPGSRDAAARTAARRLLARAFTVAPNDWRTLHLYTRIAASAERPDKSAADVALRAWELAPQVNSLIIDTATVLAASDRLPDAAVVLTRLANSPHRSPIADRAACMADAARAGDKAALFAALRLPESAFAATRAAAKPAPKWTHAPQPGEPEEPPADSPASPCAPATPAAAAAGK